MKEHGNEYAQQLQVQLPDGKKVIVNNVYLPPQRSFFAREVPEKQGFDSVTEVLTSAPVADYVITVGDFNARTGTLAPRVGDV